MAAHLDLIHLRRHALPAHFMGFDGHMVATPTSASRQTDADRPKLVASWQLDARGRPVCHWSLDTNDPCLMKA